MSRWDVIFDATLWSLAAINALNVVMKLSGIDKYMLMLSVILPATLFIGMIVSAIGMARLGRPILGSENSSFMRNAAVWVLFASLLANSASVTWTLFP